MIEIIVVEVEAGATIDDVREAGTEILAVEVEAEITNEGTMSEGTMSEGTMNEETMTEDALGVGTTNEEDKIT
jgi:hypothetical protein